MQLLKSKLFYIAIAIYLITAYFSLGHLHPDEYYQILEFAAFKLGLTSAHGLTWEFYSQIRPTLQPVLVIYLYKIVAMFGKTNPFLVAILTRVFAGILSLIAVFMFIDTFKDELKSANKQKWFILLSIFSWLAVFNGIRYSAENVSGKIFIIAICLLFNSKIDKRNFIYFSVGVLLGFSFFVRFQNAFMIIGLIAWLIFINKNLKLSSYVSIFLGLLLAIYIGVAIDHWFYGDWVFTPWRYFKANIIDGKASTFSVDPWYTYLYIAGLIPYGPLYVCGGLYFMFYRKKHVITWMMLPFIVGHLLVGHKELRFLTPLLTFMPFVILDALQVFENKYNWHFNSKLIKLNTIAWRFNCFLLIIVMFVPAAMQIKINELLFKNYAAPTAFDYITEGGNVLDFYKHLNLRPTYIPNPNQLDCKPTENCILALTCQETVKYKWHTGKLLYSDCPSWIFKLDFNNWLERTALYNVYEIRTIEK